MVKPPSIFREPKYKFKCLVPIRSILLITPQLMLTHVYYKSIFWEF